MAKEYGKAAGSLATSGFSAKATSAGIWGEKQTAKELASKLLSEPDTHIFHDLRIPTLQKANIDHVIVRGKNIVVVDSKNWKPGFYWAIGSLGFRGFRPFNSLTKRHVQAAVSYYQEKHKGHNVSGVIAVWTRKKNAHYTFLTPGLGVKFVRGENLGAHIKKQGGKTPGEASQAVINSMKGSLIK